MTTYYGIWSDWSGRNGKEWWHTNSGELFCTTLLPVALAQVMVSNAIWKRGPAYGTRKDERWEVRVIGEDGLPASSPTEEQKRIRSEAACHRCSFCENVATHWASLPNLRCYVCDEHKTLGQEWLCDYALSKSKEQSSVTADLLRIPGVTEVQITVNIEMRCGSPFDIDDSAWQIAQGVAKDIERKTGWKVDWRYQTHPLSASVKEA